LLVICESLIFYVATKGFLVGMGDPPSIIYPDGYESGKIPHPQPDIGIPVVSYCYHRDGSGESITHCHP
jgi:hypothetical protein